jgi:hypothetical protein
LLLSLVPDNRVPAGTTFKVSATYTENGKPVPNKEITFGIEVRLLLLLLLALLRRFQHRVHNCYNAANSAPWCTQPHCKKRVVA